MIISRVGSAALIVLTVAVSFSAPAAAATTIDVTQNQYFQPNRGCVNYDGGSAVESDGIDPSWHLSAGGWWDSNSPPYRVGAQSCVNYVYWSGAIDVAGGNFAPSGTGAWAQSVACQGAYYGNGLVAGPPGSGGTCKSPYMYNPVTIGNQVTLYAAVRNKKTPLTCYLNPGCGINYGAWTWWQYWDPTGLGRNCFYVSSTACYSRIEIATIFASDGWRDPIPVGACIDSTRDYNNDGIKDYWFRFYVHSRVYDIGSYSYTVNLNNLFPHPYDCDPSSIGFPDLRSQPNNWEMTWNGFIIEGTNAAGSIEVTRLLTQVTHSATDPALGAPAVYAMARDRSSITFTTGTDGWKDIWRDCIQWSTSSTFGAYSQQCFYAASGNIGWPGFSVPTVTVSGFPTGSDLYFRQQVTDDMNQVTTGPSLLLRFSYNIAPILVRNAFGGWDTTYNVVVYKDACCAGTVVYSGTTDIPNGMPPGTNQATGHTYYIKVTSGLQSDDGYVTCYYWLGYGSVTLGSAQSPTVTVTKQSRSCPL